MDLGCLSGFLFSETGFTTFGLLKDLDQIFYLDIEFLCKSINRYLLLQPKVTQPVKKRTEQENGGSKLSAQSLVRLFSPLIKHHNPIHFPFTYLFLLTLRHSIYLLAFLTTTS